MKLGTSKMHSRNSTNRDNPKKHRNDILSSELFEDSKESKKLSGDHGSAPSPSPKNKSSPENTKKQSTNRKDVLDIRFRLKKFYRFIHCVFIVAGLGLIGTGSIVIWIESQMLGNLGLNLTDLPKKLHIGSGGAVIVMAIVGQICVSIRRFKMLSWLLYLLVLCTGGCSVASCSFVSLRSYKNHNIARSKLFELMNLYNGKSGKATEKWDVLHQGYACCGVDKFTDWTEFPFGRTSLRTPMSCCRNFSILKDEFCGQNLLPYTDFKTANEIIYAKGCIETMMRSSDIWYLISGLYSGFVTFFIGAHGLFCFFLLTSRRM